MPKTLWFTTGPYKLLILCLSCCFAVSLTAQQSKTIDYAKMYGQDYQKALDFCRDNKWITDSLTKHDIQPEVAMAVIFPELIRYSTVQDYAETKALEVLYVQYGKDYANYSIGPFQMKPSFIEQLEKDWNTLIPESGKQKHGIMTFPYPDNSPARNKLLSRLKTQEWQFRYLLMFMVVTEEKFSPLLPASTTDRLAFLATAYNCGYWRPISEIEKNLTLNYFYTGLIKPALCQNYAAIALAYYLSGK